MPIFTANMGILLLVVRSWASVVQILILQLEVLGSPAPRILLKL